MVVGKSFVGSRLIKRAKSNGIALIDVDVLETLLKNHQKYPLQAIEYLPVSYTHLTLPTNREV